MRSLPCSIAGWLGADLGYRCDLWQGADVVMVDGDVGLGMGAGFFGYRAKVTAEMTFWAVPWHLRGLDLGSGPQ